MPSRIVRSSRRGRNPRTKRETIWTTIVASGVAAALPGANLPLSLVLPVDWVRGTNFERGAVLAGIRGWYSFAYAATSTFTSPTAYFSIVKHEVDEVTSGQDWTVAGPYNGEDVLYTDGAHIQIAATTPSSNLNLSRQLDVRTKRKLTSDDFIGINFMSLGASADWTMSGVFRALLVLP